MRTTGKDTVFNIYNKVMKNDFSHSATRHLGMDGLALDDVMKVQSRAMTNVNSQ